MTKNLQVACIESVYGSGDGELWCPVGTLYEAVRRENGTIHIHDSDYANHTIYIPNDSEMEEFYERHFLEIKYYVDLAKE